MNSKNQPKRNHKGQFARMKRDTKAGGLEQMLLDRAAVPDSVQADITSANDDQALRIEALDLGDDLDGVLSDSEL